MLFFSFIIFFIAKQINSLEYCCCIFSKDPLKGFKKFENKILKFDHEYLDKEEMGYKMISQCYRQYNGFPSLENINMIRNDIYTINKAECERDCTRFLSDLNEKYNSKQEENRFNEAKRLLKLKKKYESYIENKILENAKNLHKAKYCKAEVKKVDNNINKNDKDKDKGKDNYNNINEIKTNSLNILESIKLKTISQGSDSSVYDLSIDSIDDHYPSYLEVNNPKYNVQMKIEREELRSKK
jgi:hypothetical protein